MQPKPEQSKKSTGPASASNQQTSSGANELLQQAKQTTSEVVDNVQQQAGSRLDRSKDEAAKDLQKLAGAVRSMGDELGGEQQGPIAQYAAQYGRKAAEGIERLTNYLRTNDTKALVSEIENLGRRQPALLLGGAFLLGLAGARFLKSSMTPAGSMTSNASMSSNAQNTSRALPPHQPSHVPTTTATL